MIGGSNALAPTIDQIGLQVAVGPGVLWLNGVVIISPFTFVLLSANTTSYIFLNTSSGLIGVNTSGYSSSNIPIATVVTSNVRVVTLVDTRPDFTNVGGSGGGGGPYPWQNISTTGTITPTSTNQFVNASGTITITLTSGTGQVYNIVNTGAGVITLAYSASTVYQLVNQGQGVQIGWDDSTSTWRAFGGTN